VGLFFWMSIAGSLRNLASWQDRIVQTANLRKLPVVLLMSI